MKRSMLVLVALALGLLLPAAAAAKGPSEATISGDVLKKAITIRGDGETDQTPLGQLTMQAGFFPAAFGQSPDPMLPRQPKGNLGPRLTIHYVVPGGDSQTFYIDQDAYPYAKGGAVTYMKPGQPIFDMATRGGWYRAYGLKVTLVKLGLPATMARTAKSTQSRLALLAAGIGIPGALALAGAAVFYRRRKS
jgi:hypothetical protein